MVKVAIIYSSGFGHTEMQAKYVAKGAEQAGATTKLFKTEDWADDYLKELEEYDAIIFGSPTYMGTVSASFKAFMDASSSAWFEQKWKNKIAGGFSNSGSAAGDKLNTLTTLAIFAAQHCMIWVGNDLVGTSTEGEESLNRHGYYLGAAAQSANSEAQDGVNPPQSDLDSASYYGKRVAEITTKFAS